MPEVAQIILIPIVSVLILSVFGLAVLAPLAPAARHALLPAVPAVGVAFLVAGLHATAALLPVRVGVLILVGLAAALFSVPWRRGGRPWHYPRRALAWTGVAVLVGIVGASLALLPSVDLGDTGIASPTAGHDSYYFVAGSEWLQDHSILEEPEIASEPGHGNALPADGPAASSTSYHLRWGLELTGAALTSLTGADPSSTFTPWLAIWPLMLPGVCIAGSMLLGRRRASGAVAGLLLTCSAGVLHQVFNQNAASLLGVTLGLLFLSVFIGSIEKIIPLWFGAMVLGALVGSYTELAPIIAPAILAGGLLRPRHPDPRPVPSHRDHRAGRWWLNSRLGRTLTLVVLSVALVPLAWARGLQQLLANTESGFDVFPSPFQFPDKLVVVGRLLGFESLTSVATNPAAVVAFGLLACGVLFAVLLPGSRGLWLGALSGGTLLVMYLTLADRGYTQQRAVEVFLPIVLFASVLGWDTALSRVPRRLGAGLAAVLLVPVAVWTVANSFTVHVEAGGADAARHVDGDFAEAARWVEEVGGGDGQDTAVLVPSFFEQLWISDALRGEPLVSYPSINPSYFTTMSYWDGRQDRFLLVGRGATVNAGPGTVIRRNSRFELLDTSAGPVTVAAPSEEQFWEPFPDASGHLYTNAATTQLVVLGTRGASEIVLQVSSRGPELDLGLSIGDRPPAVAAGTTPKRVSVQTDDSEADSHVVRIDNRGFDPSDPGGTAVTVSGVERR